MRRHRQPAQTFVMAALATAAMIGALSMVVDAGVYFVIKRQLQTAADAAALAAVWYGPPCETTLDPNHSFGCQLDTPHLPPPSNCPGVAADRYYVPCTAATDQVQANWGVALSLCQGPTDLPSGGIKVVINAHPGALIVPSVNTYVVSLSCTAPHWFARILPHVLPTQTIGADAVATIGWRDPSNGQVLGGLYPTGTPPGPLISRLIK
jgi:hypothetical protein